MKTGITLRLSQVMLLTLPLWGCGAPAEVSTQTPEGGDPSHYVDLQSMDEAARNEFVSNHRHDVSAMAEAGECYCYQCIDHHPPPCIGKGDETDQ